MRKSLPTLSLALAFWLCSSLAAWAQRTITGRVTSGEDGSGIPAVNIIIRGTTQVTVSDADGNYSFPIPDDPQTVLVFSSVGFTSQELVVGTAASLNVVLQPDVQTLQEAVVIGYGTTSRKDVTGSIATVSAKDFQKGVVTTPEQLIAGKVAGVQIIQNSGSPGGGSQVIIRGGSSLGNGQGASNDPLYVIDGVPLSPGGISGSPNPLSLINPNDIESFSVLKDASATAIYGSRAANGVILITTKKGIAGAKPSISISSQNSISQVRKHVDVLDANAFRAFVGDVENRVVEPEDAALLGDSGFGPYNTNWQKEIYQLAFTSDNNVAVTSGVGGVPVRASVGYLNQEGVLKTDKMDRLSVGINVNPAFLDNHLKVNLQLKGSHTQNNFANQGAIGSAVRFDPTKPVYADETNSLNPNRYGGYWEWVDPLNGLPNTLAPRNPVGMLNQREDKSSVVRSVGNLQLDYNFHFLPELRANLNFGYDWSRGTGTIKVPDSAASDYGRQGVGNQYKQIKNNTLIEAYLDYTKEIRPIDTRVTLLAGYSYQDFLTQAPSFRERTFRGDTTNVPAPRFSIDYPQNRLLSYYGRANIAIKNRYILTGTLRSDASSRFAPEVRQGLFPSAAFAWSVSDEPWMKSTSRVLSNLKLRVGYGSVGQQEINPLYPYLAVYSQSANTAMYQFGGNYYYMLRPNPYDARIKWESTVTYNFGLDFGLVKDRITASVDVYRKFSYDLLNTTPTPAGANFSDQVITNVGSIQNEGIEMALNLIPVQTKDIYWSVGLNSTFNRNKVTKLTEGSDSTYVGLPVNGFGLGQFAQILSLNAPSSAFWVYKQKYDDNGQPVYNQFEDLNNDGIINEGDRRPYRQALPTFYYGINTTFSYKRITFTAVLRGAMNNYIYNVVAANRGTYNTAVLPDAFLENPHGSVLSTNFSGLNQDRAVFSDFFVQNANFLRCDNIGLSYDFGNTISNRVGLAVNANAQNLFVVTPYKGSDPEIPGGVDNSFYARPRVFIVGLNLTLR